MLALLTCILVSCYKLGKISLFGLYWEQFRNTLQKMTINSKFAFWNLESFIAKEKKEEIRADEFDVKCGASQQDRIWGENQGKIFLEKPWEVREKGRVVCRMRVTPKLSNWVGSFSLYFYRYAQKMRLIFPSSRVFSISFHLVCVKS